ncbi:leucine-rich repeat-containing protein 36 [Amia ocellicauda]|uniref:leucine-rich repeat-containing protein 36 n=1 Tax=Amia ocellicauda TaxID=2972642 RepID=UPI00346391E5
MSLLQQGNKLGLGQETRGALTNTRCAAEVGLQSPDQNRFRWSSEFSGGSESRVKSRSPGRQERDTAPQPSLHVPRPLSLGLTEHWGSDSTLHRALDFHSSREFKSSKFEEEYRPLPSPPRSSLRSTGQSPSRTRDGMRVTFAKSSSAECPAETPQPVKFRTPRGAQDPLTTVADRQPASCASTGAEGKEAGLSSSAGRAAVLRSLSPEPRRFLSANRSASPLSVSSPLKSPDSTALEARANRLLTLTSDLYVAAHLQDEASPSRRVSAASESRKPGPPSRSPSVDRLQDSVTSHPTQLGKASSQDRGRQAYSPGSLSSDLRRAGSLNSLLSDPRSGHMLDTQDSRPAENRSRPLSLRPPLPISDLSAVLRPLLDLVDQYWSGSRSLHRHQRFLTGAQDVLLGLRPLCCVECQRGSREDSEQDRGLQRGRARERGRGRGQDSGALATDFPELQQLKHQLTFTQTQLESVKNRLASVLEENNSLRSQMIATEGVSAFAGPTPSSGLQEENERLRQQLTALRDQLTRRGQLEEALDLLQDSHRSLVSTNNFLLQQLSTASLSQQPDCAPPSVTSDLHTASSRQGSSPTHRRLHALSPHSRLSHSPL